MKLKQYQFDLLLFLIVALWGSLYVGNRVILNYMPVFCLIACRMLLSAAVLVPATIRMGYLQPSRKDWPRFALVGFIGYFGSNGLLTISTRLTNASLSSLLNSTNPIFMLVFAHLLLGESITPKKVGVILTAILGAAVIVGGPGNDISPAGFGCALASVLLWSFTCIYMKRLTQKYHPLTVTAYGLLMGGIFAAPTALLEMRLTGQGIELALEPVAWLLFVVFGCTAFAHVMWNFCMAHQDAGHCAAFYPVQPMVSMLLGVLLLHEQLTPSFLLGSALIILSVAVNSLPEKKIAPKTE